MPISERLFNSRADRHWRRPVVFSLTLVFIMLVMPLVGTGWILLRRIVKDLEAEVVSSIHNRALSSARNLDNELLRIHNIEADFITNQDINRISILPTSMTAIERTEAINRLAWRIATIKNSSSVIERTEIHIPELDRSIDGIGVKPLLRDMYSSLWVSPPSLSSG